MFGRNDKNSNRRCSQSNQPLLIMIRLAVISCLLLWGVTYLKAEGWTRTANSMGIARGEGFTATLLPNGKVLIAGGGTEKVELYDPITKTFSPTASMATVRSFHTATLLNNGKVLITGGMDSSGRALATAERYNSATGSFEFVWPMHKARDHHQATLLATGSVLITGGYNKSDGQYVGLLEVYGNGEFNLVNGTITPRAGHTATLMLDGKVLIAGGYDATGPLAAAQLYFPNTGSVGTITSQMQSVRSHHNAILLPNGKVLITGGYDHTGRAVATAELYFQYSFQNTAHPMVTALSDHTATYLANGKVVIAGGWENACASAHAQLYDPVTESFTGASSMLAGRARHTATPLSDGHVLVVGGLSGFSGFAIVSEVPSSLYPSSHLNFRDFFDYNYNLKHLLANAQTTAEVYCPSGELGIFAPTGQIGGPRSGHTSTLLLNSKVLIAGGTDASGDPLGSAQLFDPNTDSSVPTGGMRESRKGHTATLLDDGKVLIAWGTNDLWGSNPASEEISAELYDSATGTFSYTKGLDRTARWNHTATKLKNGKVLIAGGENFVTSQFVFLNTAQLYDPDPQKEIFSPTGSMRQGRAFHTATLLSDGQVLITGGLTASNVALDSAELYDPIIGTFSYTTNPMGAARSHHIATLLPDGRVLITGGGLAQAELYDPNTKTFSPTGTMGAARSGHTATLLPNNKILVAGGTIVTSAYSQDNINLPTAELYDIASGLFTYTGFMGIGRASHTATGFADGKVLLAGGITNNPWTETVGTAEYYTMNSCSYGQTPLRADLAVVMVSNPPATVGKGGHFAVTTTVKNIGNRGSSEFWVLYFLSADRLLDRGSWLVGLSQESSPLARGRSRTINAAVSIPSKMSSDFFGPGVISENYYLIAYVVTKDDKDPTNNWFTCPIQVRVN